MTNANEQTRVKAKWWAGIPGQVLVGVSQLFFGIVLSGMVLYLIAQYKTGQFDTFGLATVASLLGGFPLVATFSERVKDEGTRKKLGIIGGLYLFAAICFVVFGFYFKADQAHLLPQTGRNAVLFDVIYVATFYGGAIAFIFGMWMTLEIIPQLMGLGGIKERVKVIFRSRRRKKNYTNQLIQDPKKLQGKNCDGD